MPVSVGFRGVVVGADLIDVATPFLGGDGLPSSIRTCNDRLQICATCPERSSLFLPCPCCRTMTEPPASLVQKCLLPLAFTRPFLRPARAQFVPGEVVQPCASRSQQWRPPCAEASVVTSATTSRVASYELGIGVPH